MLTICIPTRNRFGNVKARLLELLPQLTADVKVLVLDNASNPPIRTSIEDILIKDSRVRLVRHSLNIGMAGNIARCFEQCDTEWLWILGDDDPVLPTAVELVLGDTAGVSTNVCWIKYSSSCGTNSRIEQLNAERLLRHPSMGYDFVSNLFLISSTVARVRELDSLDRAMDTLNSMAPHVVLMFQLLSAGREIQLSPKWIVSHSVSPKPSWPRIRLQANLALTPQFAGGIDDKLVQLLIKFFSLHLGISAITLFLHAHKAAVNHGRTYSRLLYRMSIANYLVGSTKPFKFLVNSVLYLLFVLRFDSLLPILFSLAGRNLSHKYRTFLAD